jgi:U3 small nucleolar RNA-associated protein 3
MCLESNDNLNQREVFAMESSEEEDDDDDPMAWGARKSTFYDHDQVSSDSEAEREEEAQVLELLKKRRAKMSEEDYDWSGTFLKGQGGRDTTIQMVEEEELVEAKQDMTTEEKLDYVTRRMPHVLTLLPSFKDKHERLTEVETTLNRAVQHELPEETKPAIMLLQLEHQLLSTYLMHAAYYLGLCSSKATQKSLHPSLKSLQDTEEMLNRVETLGKHGAVKVSFVALQAYLDDPEGYTLQDTLVDEEDEEEEEEQPVSEVESDQESDAMEMSEPDSDTPLEVLKLKKPARLAESTDFGDMDQQRQLHTNKKSLHHHTSRIEQSSKSKNNRLMRLGGDMDIPYKHLVQEQNEQARKNRQVKLALRKRKKDSEDESDHAQDVPVDEDAEAFYKNIQKSRDAKRQQTKPEPVVDYSQWVDPDALDNDAKRKVTYQILKNRGLTPNRNRDIKNPRVKHRKKYDKAQKKIKSFKRVYGGDFGGAYGGEATGIKTHVTKSVKF